MNDDLLISKIDKLEKEINAVKITSRMQVSLLFFIFISLIIILLAILYFINQYSTRWVYW